MTQLTIEEAHIREAAYFLWLEDGQPEGREEEHWLKAIDALTPPTPKARKPRKAAAKAAPKAKAEPKARAPRKAKTAKATA